MHDVYLDTFFLIVPLLGQYRRKKSVAIRLEITQLFAVVSEYPIMFINVCKMPNHEFWPKT
jgi:hypothetical protein